MTLTVTLRCDNKRHYSPLKLSECVMCHHYKEFYIAAYVSCSFTVSNLQYIGPLPSVDNLRETYYRMSSSTPSSTFAPQRL